MNNYSAHWRIIIIIAIILHVIFYSALSFALPYLLPGLKDMELASLQWIDVDLITEEPPPVVAEVQEIVPAIEEAAEINYDEILPMFTSPIQDDLTYIEPIRPKPLPPPIVNKPEPPIKPPPPKKDKKITKEEADIISQLESDKSDDESEGDNLLGKPPVTINEVYPHNSFDYTGYVIVAITIGIDGKVHDTKIMLASTRSRIIDSTSRPT